MGRIRRLLAIIAVTSVVALAASCESSVPPSPRPSPSAPAPSPTPVAQPITLPTLAMPGLGGIDIPTFAPPDVIVYAMVHAALYRFDATFTPVPDLAAKPCDVAADLVTITCTLRAATFHDGSPVTAADVAFAYELVKSPNCPFAGCLTDALERVEAVDTRTVRFTLARPYSPFLSVGLADVIVQPRAPIEAAFDAFADASRNTNPAGLEVLADRIAEGLGAAEPDCEPSLEEAEDALRGVGVEPADRRLFIVFRGQAFDMCAYADYLQRALRAAATGIEADGIDAIAAAYTVLPLASDNAKVIGAGPFRVTEADPATGLVLERHEGYHHGAPVTPEIRIRILTDDATDAGVRDGSIDWRLLPPWVDLPEPGAYPAARFMQPPSQGYRALQYNVRPGRLFADRNLRQAMELCIDKERTVEAATDRAVPIYSPIPPASWAYQPGLAKPRDVEAARELIEASGWQMGADGIYQQDGRRLTAEVVVRADFEPPIAFLDRAALQVRDCGIDLTTRLVEFRDAAQMIFTYPHLLPGTTEPFDVYLGGWGLAADPDQFDFFHSSRAITESRAGPNHLNYMGFSHAGVDRLLEEGVATYDLEERRGIYRELQRALAEEQPYMFIWADTAPQLIDADLTSAGAPLDFTSDRWWWQLEALLNPAE